MGWRVSLFAGICLSLAAAFPAAGEAQDREARRRELLQERERIDAELRALDREQPGATPPPSGAETKPEEAAPQPTAMPGIEVVDQPLFSPPAGQAVTSVERDEFKFTKDFSIKDMTETAPASSSSRATGLGTTTSRSAARAPRSDSGSATSRSTRTASR